MKIINLNITTFLALGIFYFISSLSGQAGKVTADPQADSFGNILVQKGDNVTFKAKSDNNDGTVTVDQTFSTFEHGTPTYAEGGGTALVVVTFDDNAEGNDNACWLYINHRDTNSTQCENEKPFYYNVIIPKLDHQTVEGVPPAWDNTRTTIGLGEEVNCKILPDLSNTSATITWSVTSGYGTVSPTSSSKTKFTTSYEPATDTVQAEITNGSAPPVKVKVDFTYIAPTYVKRQVYETGTHLYPGDPLKCMAVSYMYYGPDTVNFYNLRGLEATCQATASGYFASQDGLSHNPNPNGTPMTDQVYEGKGTMLTASDTVTAYTSGPTYSSGDFVWNIPQKYVCQGWVGPAICTSEHHKWLTMSGSTPTLHLDKEYEATGGGPVTDTTP